MRCPYFVKAVQAKLKIICGVMRILGNMVTFYAVFLAIHILLYFLTFTY